MLRLHGLEGILHGHLDQLIKTDQIAPADAVREMHETICAENNIALLGEHAVPPQVEDYLGLDSVENIFVGELANKIVVTRNNVPGKKPGPVLMDVCEFFDIENPMRLLDVMIALKRFADHSQCVHPNGVRLFLGDQMKERKRGAFADPVVRMYLALSDNALSGGYATNVEGILVMIGKGQDVTASVWEIAPDNRMSSQESKFTGVGRQLLFYAVNRELKRGKKSIEFAMAANAELRKEGLDNKRIDVEGLRVYIRVQSDRTIKRLEALAQAGDEEAKKILQRLQAGLAESWTQDPIGCSL